MQCIGCMSSFYIAGDVFLACGDLCLDDQMLSPMDMAMQIFPARSSGQMVEFLLNGLCIEII